MTTTGTPAVLPAVLPAGTPTIVLDGHELVGSALASGLRDAGEPAVHYPVRHLHAAYEAARRSGPGLLLLELDLGHDVTGARIDALGVATRMRAFDRRVVLLTGTATPEAIGVALAGGAFGWIPKTTSFPVLLTMLRAARRGEHIISADRRTAFVERYREWASADGGRLARLTTRERSVLDDLAAGHRAAAIAERDVVAIGTVRSQIRSILGKLEVRSQIEAVALLHAGGAVARLSRDDLW